MPDPTQEKFWRIKSLKCYPQVDKMLMAGKPAPAVAIYIQNERREYTDVSLRSLSAMLGAYRRDELGKGAAFDRMPHIVVSAAREFTDRLAELRKLEDLEDVLKRRLDNAAADELLSGKKDPEINKMAKELRETWSLQHKIKMDLKLTGSRDLGTLHISAEKMAQIREKYGEVGERTLESPTSRGRITAVLNAAIKRVQMEGAHQIIDVVPESIRPRPSELEPEQEPAKKRVPIKKAAKKSDE